MLFDKFIFTRHIEKSLNQIGTHSTLILYALLQKFHQNSGTENKFCKFNSPGYFIHFSWQWIIDVHMLNFVSQFIFYPDPHAFWMLIWLMQEFSAGIFIGNLLGYNYMELLFVFLCLRELSTLMINIYVITKQNGYVTVSNKSFNK